MTAYDRCRCWCWLKIETRTEYIGYVWPLVSELKAQVIYCLVGRVKCLKIEKPIGLLELFPCLHFFRDSEKTETVWWMFGVKQNSFESIRCDMIQSQTRRTINFLFQNGDMIIMCRNRFFHAETWKSASHPFGGKTAAEWATNPQEIISSLKIPSNQWGALRLSLVPVLSW